MDKFYTFLIILRFALVLIPQNGYIHPDEFFQSLEIVGGDLFELEVIRPWEFNINSPIRCIVPPYLTIGVGLKLLQLFNYVSTRLLNISIINSYCLLVFPRLIFCIISLLNDYSLQKIAKLTRTKIEPKLYLLSTSYVILVYSTHTFSNSIELASFSLLLYYVADSILFSNVIHRQLDYVNREYEKSLSTTRKAQLHKIRYCLPVQPLRHCFKIATILSFGFFNRPTFIFFAIGPVFLWCYRGAGFKSFSLLKIHYRISILVISVLPIVSLLIIVDSFYYGYISWGEIGLNAVSLNNFVVTPLNFILYNMNPKNLELHGKHPLYTHTLVNIPLLFNGLGIAVLASFIPFIKLFLGGKYNHLPKLSSIHGLMIVSFLSPLMGLSLFQHQEPRFLLPLLVPALYLGSAYLLPSANDHDLSHRKSIKETIAPRNRYSGILLRLWYLANIVLVVIYGFAHQGGVVRFSRQFSREIAANPNTDYHIVTTHTYAVPKALMLIKRSKSILFDINPERVVLEELGSANIDDIFNKLNDILRRNQAKQRKVFLVIPGYLTERLQSESIRFKEYARFFPHLSTENLNVSHFTCSLDYTSSYYVTLSNWEVLSKFYNLLSLYIFEITVQSDAHKCFGSKFDAYMQC